jgi:hypothetical protein
MLLKLAQQDHVAKKGDLTMQLVYGRDLSNRYAFLKDWLIGAVAGFESKMNKIKREQDSRTMALVACNQKALEQYVTQIIPNIKTASPARKKSVTVGPAFTEGKKAGMNLDISKVLK